MDAYDSLSFFDGATSVGSVTGAGVAATAAGDQGINGTRYVNIISDLAFDRVVFTSSNFAFEFDNFDNMAFSPTIPVPEPASMALFATGLLGVGLVRRFRRKSA